MSKGAMRLSTLFGRGALVCGWWSAALIGLGACDGPSPRDRCAPDAEVIASVQAPLQFSCDELNPDLDLDPNSPDYGHATCSVIEGRRPSVHPDYCDCTEEGYAPIAASESEAAAQAAIGTYRCDSACCETLCFCELKQLTGEDLAACQNSGVRVGENGWCFVAPNQGLGALEAIEMNDHSYQARCPDPQAIVFSGDYLDGTRLISCWR
ncbi:MAG TPA: hypothetical protein VHO25_08510 [Polyangiaceae bacterium]|nr:hypothetical protein [Polyangiaceae bacterium]